MENVLIKLIEQLPAIVTAIGVIVAAVLSYLANHQGKKNAKAIEVVREDVNSKVQQLLEVTARSSKAEGKLEEKTEQNEREVSGKKHDKPVDIRPG